MERGHDVGRLQNTVIHTFTGVSQFGPYRAEEFLKNPVYSQRHVLSTGSCRAARSPLISAS